MLRGNVVSCEGAILNCVTQRAVRTDMQQRNYTAIDDRLLEAVRKEAAEQGRDERALIDEAVRRYLDAPSASLVESLRREQELSQEREFGALLDRMSSRFDLEEDEAMDLVNTEIRAMYEERRAAREREGEQR